MVLMKSRGIVSLVFFSLSLGLLSCGGSEPGDSAAEAPPAGGQDFPAVEGWTQAGEVLIYDADNLWEYINGAAELFVEFGVQTTRVADLASGGVTVTVDLYDMGAPLNAFGVYEREKPGDDIPVPGAMAGLVSAPYQALLVKGRTYAKVNTLEGELTDESGRGLLEALAAALPGGADLPPELELLPEAGKVAGTEGYKPMAFLGQSALTDCIYAEYSLAGEDAWQGFVVLPAAATSVWEELAGAWESLDHNGATVLFKEVPYSGFVGIMQQGDRVFGVAEASDQATMLARLEAFGG